MKKTVTRYRPATVIVACPSLSWIMLNIINYAKLEKLNLEGSPSVWYL
jgi:hypothetical protein